MPYYIHDIRQLYGPGCEAQRVEREGTIYTKAVRAVCVPYPAGSLLAAWEVLRGRAFAFRWPEPGDLEQIIERNHR